MAGQTPTPPVLPSAQDLKAHLRIQTDKELPALSRFLLQAVAQIEVATGKSLTTESVTWYDDAVSLRIDEAPTSLILGYTPVEVSSVVVTDQQNNVVPASNYTVRNDLGLIVGNPGPIWNGQSQFCFDNGPYTITATAGAGTGATYATRQIYQIRELILDYGAMLYQQRTPGEGDRASGRHGDRLHADRQGHGTPGRIARGIRLLKGPVSSR